MFLCVIITFFLSAVYVHITLYYCYSQGLVYKNGTMYEGTGLYGQSEVIQIDHRNGKRALQSPVLPKKYFGNVCFKCVRLSLSFSLVSLFLFFSLSFVELFSCVLSRRHMKKKMYNMHIPFSLAYI
jgi:hypothetical protein